VKVILKTRLLFVALAWLLPFSVMAAPPVSFHRDGHGALHHSFGSGNLSFSDSPATNTSGFVG
jgi:hypothetical protein